MKKRSSILTDGVKQLNQLLLANAIVHFRHKFMKLFSQVLALTDILLDPINQFQMNELVVVKLVWRRFLIKAFRDKLTYRCSCNPFGGEGLFCLLNHFNVLMFAQISM